ncbi:MAG: LysR family transcriptional regulator, partial [Candidatus Competibacteraceae bacterium]|nr:LysR family transcriptional regulator [Candidatus Competibacteraceae bacterium]
HGMAWLPHNSVRHHLARGELVRAGSPDWNIPLRLMLYRSVEKTSPAVESLWQFLLEKTKK